MFAIMETALVFFAGQALETAAANSSRMIMTGQAQTQRSNGEFKNAVCGKIYGLFNCSSGVYVDVKKFPSFDVDQPDQSDRPGWKVGREFQLSARWTGRHRGGAAVLSMAGLCFVAGFNLADMADDKRLLAATAIFRNEPYQ